VPSSLITSRTYGFSVNASSTIASAVSSFTTTRIPGPNFPTVSITKPTGKIDPSVIYILYASVNDPCPSISNPVLVFKWMDSIGNVLSTSSNLVLMPYTLAMNSTTTFTLECYYKTFSVLRNSIMIVTEGEILKVSTGGDQTLGIRSGIKLTGQFSSSLQVVEYANYIFQWYCYTTAYEICKDLQSTNAILLLDIEEGIAANLDNRIAVGSYLFYFVAKNVNSGITRVSTFGICVAFNQ
jgi:hypothetical protein